MCGYFKGVLRSNDLKILYKIIIQEILIEIPQELGKL